MKGAAQDAPECQTGMHRFCAGPKVIRRPGAPKWEAPIQTLRCGCACHRGPPMDSPVSSVRLIRER